ncbi:MAG: ORF6N domain-containing protein [Desulfomonilia bacterium]|jgi:hypothetical protein
MFQLSREEFENLRSQIVTLNRGGRRYLPYAFTEQGLMQGEQADEIRGHHCL